MDLLDTCKKNLKNKVFPLLIVLSASQLTLSTPEVIALQQYCVCVYHCPLCIHPLAPSYLPDQIQASFLQYSVLLFISDLFSYPNIQPCHLSTNIVVLDCLLGVTSWGRGCHERGFVKYLKMYYNLWIAKNSSFPCPYTSIFF